MRVRASRVGERSRKKSDKNDGGQIRSDAGRLRLSINHPGVAQLLAHASASLRTKSHPDASGLRRHRLW
jgi:hypothetical protein